MADCDVEQTAIWQRATLRPSMQRTAGAAAQPGLSPIARGADDVQCDPHGRLAHLHAALPRRHLGRQRIAQLAGDLRGMWGPQRLGKARARDSGRQTKASRHQGRRAGSTWCRSQLQAVGLPGCLTSMSLGKALRIMAGLQPTGGAGTAADQWHTARSSMRRKARGAHGWMARRAGAAAMEAGHLKAGAVVLRTTRHSSLSWVLKKERCPTGLNSCGQAGGPCARIKCAQIASWMPGCTTFKRQHHPPTHLIHGIVQLGGLGEVGCTRDNGLDEDRIRHHHHLHMQQPHLQGRQPRAGPAGREASAGDAALAKARAGRRRSSRRAFECVSRTLNMPLAPYFWQESCQKRCTLRTFICGRGSASRQGGSAGKNRRQGCRRSGSGRLAGLGGPQRSLAVRLRAPEGGGPAAWRPAEGLAA